MLISAIVFLIGLLLLYYGAESMVTGSSRLALSFGVRPLVIGMTIVALATSMPEMMVTVMSLVRGSSDLAAGNIIGSNIANIALILGAASLVSPLRVARRTLSREIPMMIGASVLLFLFSLDGRLYFVDGLLLFSGLILFLTYCLRSAKEEGLERPLPEEVVQEEKNRRKKDLLFIVLGFFGLGIGAEMMVRSAVEIARFFGVTELIIGMSVMALGTSLPELAASMVSIWRGEIELSVGNVIGSNIFNIMFVFGICPIFQKIMIEPETLRFQMPVMLLMSFLLLPLIRRRMSLGKSEGALLLSSYVVFIISLYH
ncbi:MAG TPA: calcium/sodium antiporter [Desulfuromonadales bacterium]|nr:calcium/sodium antiporter [Desulfuromonadales bacterium]